MNSTTSTPAVVTQQQTTLTASSYGNAVQSLYVAYFGRPADPQGLANFENALQSAGAPDTTPELATAYATNPSVQSLINSFGTSNESKNLYGSGSSADFVNAVFLYTLNRAPLPAGLAFWSGAIDNGSVSKGDAALAIMSGALTNTTAQGLIDAALVNNRIAAASQFTASLNTPTDVSAYVGSKAAQLARAMLASVTDTTSLPAFQSSIDATIAAIVAANPISFPLQQAYRALVDAGYTKSFAITGSCTGSGTKTSSPLASGTTFDGQAALSWTETLALTLSNCPTSKITQNLNIYTTAAYVPLGFVVPGTYYGVFSASAAIPTVVSVGQSASIGTAQVYTDSTMTVPNGSIVWSFNVPSGNATSATIELITKIYNNGNTLVVEDQDFYTLSSSGVLTPTYTDLQYFTGSSPSFVLTFQ